MRALGPPRFLLFQPLAMAASISSTIAIAMAPHPHPHIRLPHPHPRTNPNPKFVSSPTISVVYSKTMFCSFSGSAELRETVTTSTTGMKKKKVVPPCTATVTEHHQQQQQQQKKKKKAYLKQKEKKMDSNKAKGLGSSASSALKLSDSVCPGCGVTMQDKNPNAPGFFIIPRRMSEEVEEVEEEEEEEGSEVRSLRGSGEYEDEDEDDEDEIGLSENEGIDYDDDGGGGEEDEGEGFEEEGIEGSKESKKSGWTWITVDPNDKALAELDGEINGEEELDEAEIERELMREEEWMKGLDGFAPASRDFGSGGALNLKKWDRNRSSKGERDKNDELDKKRLVVCARCHELRHYGKVKDESKENLLPDFDFEATVGARLVRTHATRTVVVMVVDSVDFDGSFPRRVSALLAELEEKEASSWRENQPGNVPRLILVANKIDLLPRQISPVRLDHWVRRRAKDGGAPKLSGLFLISCVKQWGVKALLECIKEMAGPRGEVWVVGAQNAGKSSLINALAKASKGSGLTQLTEAAIPGTTLGLVRLGGILPANAKLFDTPGLLHPHQITARLNREELKLVQVRKELRPRTYRVKVGDTIHVGGLLRLDVKDISTSSMYITIWASISLTCHFSKTQKAKEIFEKHIGARLQPPLDKERQDELGPWVQTPISIIGDSFEKSSTDIAISGLGWLGIAIKGTVDLDVWTYEGVGITTRKALVPDMARYFEKAGFTVLKGGTMPA